ncbi:ATP-dependent DNA helicase, RecQ family [Chitinophaga jiangningensis]|uniref:DNA 3'-5' helicase n=1 Tax=Chitinophaga jiangningensis TaxID=1419482 RepID=A0A1M6VAX7_9BACT|nr:UvrD-helicase domain-containing protein [Chitinophaga jiangningensis]SHK78531.1 ATP-dependent DNA helicase, RecQ family [Chitinophaga jiangningensis]
MKLIDVLKENQLNVEYVRKGMKLLGLDLDKLDLISSSLTTEILPLLKSVEGLTHHTSRMEKISLRKRLDKFIVVVKADTIVSLPKKERETTPPQQVMQPSRPFVKYNEGNRKLGIVKFYEASKGFGFIHSFADNKACFVHVKKMRCQGLKEDEIVIFETQPSQKKAGELDAFNVTNRIPVLIINNDTAARSEAFPLIESSPEKEISLTGLYPTGFYEIRASIRLGNWDIEILENSNIAKRDVIGFGKKILSGMLMRKGYWKAVDRLAMLLKGYISDRELTATYHKTIEEVSQRKLQDILPLVPMIMEVHGVAVALEKWSQKFNPVSFAMWWLMELPNLPLPKSSEEKECWKHKILPALDWQQLQIVISRLSLQSEGRQLMDDAYQQLAGKGWKITSAEEEQAVVEFLGTFSSVYPLVRLTADQFECETAFLVELYRRNFLTGLPQAAINEHLGHLTTVMEKVKFVEQLPVENILEVYEQLPDLSHYREQYIQRLLNNLVSQVNYICFDLESDGEQVAEFAWKNNIGISTHKDFSNKETGIARLVSLINDGRLVIGQNIRAFDLEVLARKGASPAPSLIWDTLEIELLLHPRRQSFALKTAHHAAEDTSLTFQLFLNQLGRLMTMDTPIDLQAPFIPPVILDIISEFRTGNGGKLPAHLYFEQSARQFFRTESGFQQMTDDSCQAFRKATQFAGTTVIIAPEMLWELLSAMHPLKFLSTDTARMQGISAEKVYDNLKELPRLAAILTQYLITCHQQNIVPYFDQLPAVIRRLIPTVKVAAICETIHPAAGDAVCVAPGQIDSLKNRFSEPTQVLCIGTELYDLTTKIKLGQDYDFFTVIDRLKEPPVWLHMSGGNSFTGITREQCRLLGITDFPDHINNIWLEKTDRATYRVWCNLHLSNYLQDAGLQVTSSIPWTDGAIKKEFAYVVRPDTRLSGYIAASKRVNPESLNRKSYWLYQFRLLEAATAGSGRPILLLVNNPKEINDLYTYARVLDYFLPDQRATLARQIELLHSHPGGRKLLVLPFDKLGEVLLLNTTHGLDIVWDSFSLREKAQMLKGLMSVGDQVSDDPVPAVDVSDREQDHYSLIKMHRPLIDFYYQAIQQNNASSRLLLLDPRLTDYFGIEKTLAAKDLQVVMWQKESDYSADRKVIDPYFREAERPPLNLNLEDAKEILRRVFLAREDGKAPWPWYDYQHAYLNSILPAKDDLLISLPTGAGKSLLFQGPALFRSAFSGKLSIVICPLRALMQDQVDGLWNKGFFSNVDYLSGDKEQSEVNDIYRRIAGGELTLLYITPERFRSRAFENSLLTRMDSDSGLEYAIFDEAHCISQWGQEFRPDYLNAARKIAGLSRQLTARKLLFSATISEQVFEEIKILLPGIHAVSDTEKSYNPVRDHIRMDFRHQIVEEDRLPEIANYLKKNNFSPSLSRAIIFVKSRRKAEESAEGMGDSLNAVYGGQCAFADKVGVFHAGMDTEDRKDAYERFKSGELVVLFATKAFGMGMDIPNIHFVAHYSPSGTFEDFLQEVGRAGRNETQRLEAGFTTENPIKTLCLTAGNDFAKLKDQLHESRISWHDVKDMKKVMEDYLSNFRPLIADAEIPFAIPFNLYSSEKGSTEEELDNKFRMGLHWLEKLGRIRLGYFTITHVAIDAVSLRGLAAKLSDGAEKEITQICQAILSLMLQADPIEDMVQISLSALRDMTRLSLTNIFSGLIRAHKLNYFLLEQKVILLPTKLRQAEVRYSCDSHTESEKYLALKVMFALARLIMNATPLSESKTFEEEDINTMLTAAIQLVMEDGGLPWSKKETLPAREKEYAAYLHDIARKRVKHAFTIIRLLGKTRHESKMEKVLDTNVKVRIRQTLVNGYHKKEEWLGKITGLERDCHHLMDYVAKKYFTENIKRFNWPDIIAHLNCTEDVNYLGGLLHILSVAGYCRSGGLLPSGIEVYLQSVDPIIEGDLQSNDKLIFDEFEETRKVRELKLIALEVLAGFHKGERKVQGTDGLVSQVMLESDLRKRQDQFIRKYFSCNSLDSLLTLLQSELNPDDPLLVKWRGDAISTEENRLNKEQREVYDAAVDQHINVMAGPGSGKTHTLTLRVARLVHHIGVKPEDILILAYNRAVVSELKQRLGRLFNDLGYGNLVRQLKIFTFHGLAKKYCEEQLTNKPFDQWENILLNQLIKAPGAVMNRLAPLQHILVDEFQDINSVRVELLNRLQQLTHAKLFIIGDPNQSIYGYERVKAGKPMSPWPYYAEFNELFGPKLYELRNNHRSFPAILELASTVLDADKEHKELLSKPTRIPDKSFVKDYVQLIELTETMMWWWDQIPGLLQERIGNRPYRQLAILFRTNNEVYRGYQKVKSLHLPNVRIRIQGSLPYEFTRIRECHEVLLFLRAQINEIIPVNFKDTIKQHILALIETYPNWNHFYLRVMYSLVADFLDEAEDQPFFNQLLDYITELTHKDDGQLFKIYEKYADEFAADLVETEIVLTTMHKVKGLEFDCVMVPPSFSDLPLKIDEEASAEAISEQLDEEKRLMYVAYTRARYRLLVFRHHREVALVRGETYQFKDANNSRLGIPVLPEIRKLNIGWGASSYVFNKKIHEFIKTEVKSGDYVEVRKRTVDNVEQPFAVYELFKVGHSLPLGQLSKDAGKIRLFTKCSGFIVNEVAVWTYQDTLNADGDNNNGYEKGWCEDAIKQGYIYLVDFAGFGKPEEED